jgi:hypothetical protein
MPPPEKEVEEVIERLYAVGNELGPKKHYD